MLNNVDKIIWLLKTVIKLTRWKSNENTLFQCLSTRKDYIRIWFLYWFYNNNAFWEWVCVTNLLEQQKCSTSSTLRVIYDRLDEKGNIYPIPVVIQKWIGT